MANLRSQNAEIEVKSQNMVTINLTKEDADAMLSALDKFIDSGNERMLGERKFTPDYEEVMAAIRTSLQIMLNRKKQES